VLDTWAGLDDQWMYVDYALVNEETGQVFATGRELGYFDGFDAGRLVERGLAAGPRAARPRARRPLLPARRAGRRRPRAPADRLARHVRRDVPSPAYLLLAVLVLLVPPGIAALRAASFETRRWAESDHAPSSAADDDGGDDD
jgi:hypothetical protein